MLPSLLLGSALVGLLLLLSIVVVARARVRARGAILARAQALLYAAHDFEGALAVLEPLRRVAYWGAFAEVLRADALRMLLRVDEAAEAMLAIRPALSKWQFPFFVPNAMVDTLVCAGRYADALAVEAAIPEPARASALAARDASFGLVQINLAEAEVNLGRPEAALARLEGWDEGAKALPITAAGLGLQRGWILGLLGRGEEAMAAVATMRREALGARFAAEYHLSRTFALLACQRLDEADAELAEALACAVRPSSTRNVLFLKARVADARGDAGLAERLCRDAAAHPHRWQGGDGLLLLGDLCARRGDEGAAARAWALVLERDPESASAREAAARVARASDVSAATSAERAERARTASAASVPTSLQIAWIDRVGASRPHLAVALGALLVVLSTGLLALTAGVGETRPLHAFLPRVPEVEAGAVRVADGTFLMGGTLHDDERPTRLVSVKGFWLDRTEVSAASYDACVDEGSCTAGGQLQGCTGGCAWRADDPINCVDYAQAQAYCAWRGGRLPTEAEWEYAAKGGAEQRTYPWGDAEPLAQLCWKRKPEEGTCAVGSFPAGASRDGAMDLAGGVREWTSSPYFAAPPDPSAARSRVVRGSAWSDENADWTRAAYRASQDPAMGGQNLGIRCAYDAAPAREAAAGDE